MKIIKKEDIEWIGYNKMCYIDNLDKVKDTAKNKIYCGSFQSNNTYKIWRLPSALVIVGKDFL